MGQLDSDRQGRLVLLSESGEAAVFRAGFSYTAPSEWDLSWLVFLRHPLVLG